MARTQGSVVTTEDIIEKEVKEWAKVNRTIREMIEHQLGEFDHKIHEEGLSTAGHLEIMSGLKDLLATSVKVVESGLKTLNATNKIDEVDPTSVMKEMLQ